MFYVFINVSVDYIYCVIDIGFYIFKWVIFCGWYDFGGSCMDDIIYFIYCMIEMFVIVYVIDKKLNGWIVIIDFCYFLLFYFIVGIDDDLVRFVFF